MGGVNNVRTPPSHGYVESGRSQREPQGHRVKWAMGNWN